MNGIKLAVTGKGGVGKTTVSSLLARIYAAEGKQVLAIDANPDANLAIALGIPKGDLARIVPISDMGALIEERTGAKPGSVGAYFKLNPKVDDIPERFSVNRENLRLLVMGTVKKGGGGCLCPESALINTLTTHLLLRRSEVIIMDMDAGVEHLGRGTAAAVDAFIVVVEPGQRSLQTAFAVKQLAKGIGIDRCFAVGSKTRTAEDRRFILDNLTGFEVLGFINYDQQVADADRRGVGVFDVAPGAVAEARKIKERLEGILAESKR